MAIRHYANQAAVQELKHLHPSVHVHIISQLLERHPNLHADTSWDVLAKQLFMNHDYARNRLLPF